MHMLRFILVIAIVAGCWVSAPAQWPMAVVAYYSDSYEEWEIRDVMDVNIGNLRTVWDMGDWQFKDWQYDIEGSTGQIRLKWVTDFNVWELSADGLLYTARTRRTNDFSGWEVWGHGQEITIQSHHPIVREEWFTVKSNIGDFQIYTTQVGELWDWTAPDELYETVSPHLKFFLMFLAVFNRTMIR